MFAQTDGILSVSVTTSSAGGNFAPKNIEAIWIQDDAGNFVKTLLANAATRKTHLNTWQAITLASGSEYNVVDAVTGSTKTSHGTRTCTWNGTNVSGTIVADGTYHLYMELTDKNATGNISSFTFVKGTSADSQTPANEPSFSNISLDWQPASGTNVNNISNEISIFPNPGKGLYAITGSNFQEVEIRDIAGKVILKSNSRTIDITNYPDGIYLMLLKIDNKVVINKLIKY